MRSLIKYTFGILLFLWIIISGFGCSGGQIQYPQPLEFSGDGSYVLKEGEYELNDKEYRADYGTITVPENRWNEQTRFIHIPFIRIHSLTGNSDEPIFGLSGGPGQSNLYFNPLDTLLYDHDFILVGYRGVDGSCVLHCPEVEDAIKNMTEDILSEKSLQEIGKAWAASMQRFKSSGVDVNGYTIPAVAEDLETVRKVLNYNRVNIVAESYGTRVAYIYGVMHPKSVHRSVMIGVNPPGGFIWDSDRTDRIIKKYSDLWAKDPIRSKECPDISAAMKRVLENLPAKWNSFSIIPGKVRIGTFTMLFHRKEAALVFDAYAAAYKGDYSGLALLSQAFDYMIPNIVWGDMATKAISADLSFWKEEMIEKSDSTILGAPMTEFSWKSLKYGKLNIDLIPDSLRVPVKSDVETLLLSGNVDITNPPECGTDLLRYLTNGKQIIMSDAGHVGDIRYLQSNATKGLVADFINTGVIDTSEIRYVPMDFNISTGLPGLAKTLLSAARILVLLLTAGLIWLIV